jgi:hypothetical protein
MLLERAQRPRATALQRRLLGVQMASVGYFRLGLSAQLDRAAARNFADVLINCSELYRSLGGIHGSVHGMPFCSDAMEAEMVPGDIILVEKSNGAGLTVRYYLPRNKTKDGN